MNDPENIAPNKVGWLAIQHKDGWWVGTEAGVTCYKEIALAKAALTIIWQREGGGRLNYRIFRFTNSNLKRVGEHTPPKSARQALKDYEASINPKPQQTNQTKG